MGHWFKGNYSFIHNRMCIIFFLVDIMHMVLKTTLKNSFAHENHE